MSVMAELIIVREAVAPDCDRRSLPLKFAPVLPLLVPRLAVVRDPTVTSRLVLPFTVASLVKIFTALKPVVPAGAVSMKPLALEVIDVMPEAAPAAERAIFSAPDVVSYVTS